MIVENPFRCDGCGVAKGDANKWLLGFALMPGLDADLNIPSPSYLSHVLTGYAIVQWDEYFATTKDVPVHHLCSEACALKKQAEFIRR